MDAFLTAIENRQVVVSSRLVAKRFDKKHFHVLRDIDNILKDIRKGLDTPPMFHESTYIHPQNGQRYREYLMNRDGLTFLIMGFTGKKAAEWKIKYIKTFNEMEEKLKANSMLHQSFSDALKIALKKAIELEETQAKMLPKNCNFNRWQ